MDKGMGCFQSFLAFFFKHSKKKMLMKTQFGNLTVAGLEVSVNDGDDGLVMEVVHSSCNLHRPVYQCARGDAFPSEGPVQRSPSSILHDQAQVGFLQAHPQESHDVGMVEHGEELGLLTHALQSLRHVLVGVAAGCLDGHLCIPP